MILFCLLRVKAVVCDARVVLVRIEYQDCQTMQRQF